MILLTCRNVLNFQKWLLAMYWLIGSLISLKRKLLGSRINKTSNHYMLKSKRRVRIQCYLYAKKFMENIYQEITDIMWSKATCYNTEKTIAQNLIGIWHWPKYILDFDMIKRGNLFHLVIISSSQRPNILLCLVPCVC